MKTSGQIRRAAVWNAWAEALSHLTIVLAVVGIVIGIATGWWAGAGLAFAPVLVFYFGTLGYKTLEAIDEALAQTRKGWRR